jgi:hypothetical protein
MFSVQGIEVQGTPLGTDTYIQEFLAHNCIKIPNYIHLLESITDGFVQFQLVKFCLNTCTQYMIANITLPPQEQFLSAQHRHIDTAIANAIPRESTRGSFRQWDKDDYDLAVTMLQKPHALGGCGMTPNVIAQTSAKVAMASRFLGLVGSLPPDEQNLYLPNRVVHDPDTWTAPHRLQLRREYDILVNNHGYLVQEMYTVQDPPDPPSDVLLLPPLKCLYKANVRMQEPPQPGDSRLCHRLNAPCLGR